MDNADLNEKFVVAEHFKKNVADDAPVKIAYMSENFEKLILVKIEDIRGLAIPRHHHDLEKESLDCEILNDLGGKDAAEVTVAGIWELLKLQRNGGDGKLHNDGCANLFYVSDINGTLRTLYARWSRNGWGFGAADPEEMHSWWTSQCRVFTR